jgi:teichuronic acid exporter
MNVNINKGNSVIAKKSDAVKGVSWSALELIFRDAFSFIIRLVLVRILLPEEFGLIGMAVVFTGLVQVINELGFGSALIQKKSSHLKDIHYQTVFWSTVGFSIFLFALMIIVIAPLGAIFYRESSLTNVIRMLSIPILLKPLVLVPRIKLTRDLNFKKLAIVNIVGSIVSGIISLILAILGFGVWAIAIQGTVQMLIIIPIIWIYVNWVPKLTFSFIVFKEIFSFGIFVLAKSVTVFIIGNIDYLFVGRLLNSYYVGIYTLAFTLTDLFRSHIMGILNKVMFPIYGRVQDDIKKISSYYLKVIRYNTAIIFPIMIGLFLVGEDFISIFYEDQWQAAVVPLKILSVAVMFHSLAGSSSTVLLGIGKVNLDFKVYILLSVFITIPLLYILIYFYGINGAAFTILIVKVIGLLITSILMKKTINTGLAKIWFSALPNFLGGIGIISSILIFNSKSNLDRLLLSVMIKIIIGIVVYLMIVLPFYKSELKEVIKYIKTKLRVIT